ncbi:squalene/phytoene synthase family protein [Shouchella shacheensis]|uniref:squalene/phytoene synthase family protein n=1 Tax=Shouchella shacheensis TaxID=1649580 RepID=UPI0007404AAC|nr:phytoene/squalene synthase family protein [Shouchella shacheensis]
MSKTNDLYTEAMEMLKATSRTFFIPISYLPPALKEGVAGAYLAMRAIDEIEDHPELPSADKIHLLRSIRDILKTDGDHGKLHALFQPFRAKLPEVTLRLSDWSRLSPDAVTAKVLQSTSDMADGMADWVENEWQIESKEDLDAYTYYVAGLVGLMLSDLWEWYEDIKTDKDLAVAFGRGLQAVNMIRNRSDDLSRGVDFFPDEWGSDEMLAYARTNLASADAYLESLPPGPIRVFCQIPLTLAHGTLDAIAKNEEKLSRAEVSRLVSQVLDEAGAS